MHAEKVFPTPMLQEKDPCHLLFMPDIRLYFLKHYAYLVLIMSELLLTINLKQNKN